MNVWRSKGPSCARTRGGFRGRMWGLYPLSPAEGGVPPSALYVFAGPDPIPKITVALAPEVRPSLLLHRAFGTCPTRYRCLPTGVTGSRSRPTPAGLANSTAVVLCWPDGNWGIFYPGFGRPPSLSPTVSFCACRSSSIDAEHDRAGRVNVGVDLIGTERLNVVPTLLCCCDGSTRVSIEVWSQPSGN